MIALYFTMLAAVGQVQSSDLETALAVLDVVETKSISVDYQQEPLAFIIDDLGERVGVPIRGDWSSLERLGIAPETRVSLRFASTRAATVLASLTLSLGDELERPVLESHAGQMMLTRVAALGVMRLTTVYDVRDLLADDALVKRLRAESPPIEPDSKETDTAADEPSRDQPQIPHDVPDDRPPGVPDMPVLDPDTTAIKPLTPAEKLLLLITDHVDPEAWMNFGGNRALISETNGVLVVSATPTTHRKIRDALRLLRAAQTTAITVDAVVIDLPRANWDALERRFGRDASALASSLLTDKEAVVLWRGTEPVAEGRTLEVESAGSDTTIQLVIEPTADRTTGTLNVRCEAATTHGKDRRSVATTLRLASDARAAAFELPAATPGTTMRFVVLTIRR